jgi:hypothetical protein
MRDSIDKIVNSYFGVITKEPFTYKGVEYLPKPLQISPLLLRGFTCPPNCGGCCPRFSLDYLPCEDLPKGVKPRIISLNGKRVKIFSDTQQEHKSAFCKYLSHEGRCYIYKQRPFSCDFELIRFLRYSFPDHPNILTQKLFGRGWNMTKITGEKGALCEMTYVTKDTIKEVVRKVERLQQWCDWFGLQNKCPDILKYLKTTLITGVKSQVITIN